MFDSSVERVMQEAGEKYLFELYVGKRVRLSTGRYTKRLSLDEKGKHTIESVEIAFYEYTGENCDIPTYTVTFTVLSAAEKSRTRIKSDWFF